jgi:Protease subunit of ATP-dependent Clp proteases
MTTPTLRGDSTARTKKAARDYTLDDLHAHRVNKNSFTVFVGSDPLSAISAEEGGGEAGVEHNMADRFEMNLNFLSSIDPDRAILVVMSSCGGDWDAGMQMFGSILMCPNPVTVLGTKWCRSMTSIIPLAADKFVMRPPTKYMIHRGTYGFDGLDQAADTDDIERRKMHEMMTRIYVARLREQGKMRRYSENRIREWLQRSFEKSIDLWLTTDEATTYGFADNVFDGDLKKLRATKKDLDRRARMLEVLRRPIQVQVSIT